MGYLPLRTKLKPSLYAGLSLLFLIGCSTPNQLECDHKWWCRDSIQNFAFYSALEPQSHAIEKKVETVYLSWADDILQATNFRELHTIKNSIHREWQPNPESIVQKLMAHPKESFKILEGCDHHWRLNNLNYPLSADHEIPPWTTELLETQLRNRSLESIVIQQVDEHTALITDICGSGGAYNMVQSNYLYRERSGGITIEPISTPEYDIETQTIISDNININNDAGLIHYDPATRIFSRFRKYRGLGDCGKVTDYRLEGDRMVIQEVREDKVCNSFTDPIVKPEQFPRIYP